VPKNGDYVAVYVRRPSQPADVLSLLSLNYVAVYVWRPFPLADVLVIEPKQQQPMHKHFAGPEVNKALSQVREMCGEV
jgi:hypothetical protein